MNWFDDWRVQAGSAVTALVGMALIVIQMLAVQLTATITGLRPDANLNLFSYPPLWFTAAPAQRTGMADTDMLHWTLVLAMTLLLALVVTIAVRAWVKWEKDPQNRKGLESARKAAKEIGEAALTNPARARKLRPTLKHPKIVDVAVPLGIYRLVKLFISMEDPVIVIGPSRSGKGLYIVINFIIQAPGAVVATSLKFDNVDMTMRQRERQGSRVWIFAPGMPDGESRGHVLRWNPVPGCEDEDTLLRRVKTLVPKDAFGGSTTNGGHWDTLGQQLTACLFHAAALDGRTVDDIWDWVVNSARAQTAADIIRHHPDGIRSLGEFLNHILNEPADKLATSWSTLPTSLAFLESNSVRSWLKPEPGDDFDFADFALDKGTLYVVAKEDLPDAYLHMSEALIAELDFTLNGLSAGMEGRVDPPVMFILDEAANFKIKKLPELVTAGGGLGKVVVAVFQSRSQMQEWGQQAERAMFDAAAARIILPGGADYSQLDEMANLAGTFERIRLSKTYSRHGTSTSQGEEEKKIIRANELRTLERGYGLLFYRQLRPIIVKLSPFTELPAFDQMAADAQDLAQDIAGKSMYYKKLQERGLIA